MRYLVRQDLLGRGRPGWDADQMLQWQAHGGFSVHADTRVEDWDRLALERLIRYCARPTFSLQRRCAGQLPRLDAETLIYKLPRPDHRGRTEIVLMPEELLQRLADLIPPPRMHRHRYYGCFAPHAAMRSAVTTTAGPDEGLAADEARAQAVLGRFEQEAQTTASFRSPHTIQLYDFGRADDGAFYYVMELLDGLDLSTLVDRYGPQEPARVIHLKVQAGHSLEEAHRAGLIHRDIKPANLFVCRHGTDDDFVKVLDFGLVKEVDARGDDALQLTRQGVVLGTPGFMAPELALGKDHVDGRADLYALGCVAYWLLTGSLVFQGDTPMEQMVQHAKDPPSPPSSRSEHDIPEALDMIILACLAKDPAERPASAQDLARQLQACPVDRPWTAEHATRWWDVHRPGGTDQGASAEWGNGNRRLLASFSG